MRCRPTRPWKAAPQTTLTAEGYTGDPINLALVATEEEIHCAMLKAGWTPADPITLKSSVRIAADTIERRPYRNAPVSNLYVWDRKQDLAFEQPVGNSPKQRHHVRFWRSEQVDANGKPLWLGAATYDVSVGLSRTTGRVTHHIAPNVDAERDKLIKDLEDASTVEGVYWIDGFQDKLTGQNGGGDPYETDGRLEVGIIASQPQ